MREIEIVKRMAMFVLATPRSSSQTPPLLPIFLHVVLPSLISNIDSQQPVEQNVTADILATIISSALTAAAHLDWAVRTICSEHRPILGQHSPAMVRQLAAELRTQKDKPAGKLVAQKLAASQGFVTNFPFFVKELNAWKAFYMIWSLLCRYRYRFLYISGQRSYGTISTNSTKTGENVRQQAFWVGSHAWSGGQSTRQGTSLLPL